MGSASASKRPVGAIARDLSGVVFDKEDPIVQGHIALMQACTQEDVPAEAGWIAHEGLWTYNGRSYPKCTCGRDWAIGPIRHSMGSSITPARFTPGSRNSRFRTLWFPARVAICHTIGRAPSASGISATCWPSRTGRLFGCWPVLAPISLRQKSRMPSRALPHALAV